MTLHIPTLMLALLLGFLLLTLELGISHQRLRSRPELRSWSAGSWALLLGFAALAARSAIPLWLSIVAGNVLICVGQALYVHALYRLLTDGPAPRWIAVALVLSLLGTVAMLDWPLNQRTAVLSMVFALFLCPAVLVILRHGWHAERSLRTVAATFALAVAALALRAVHGWTHPADYGDVLQASLGQGLTFLVAYMCLMGAGFGFVLAVFERVASQLETLARLDGMTGCLNRSTTDSLLAHELQRSRRAGAPMSFVLLDLDHFKQINDLHGHGTGDAVLKQFAKTVRGGLRDSDVFGRMGGEEFGLILPGTDEPGAQQLMEGIRRTVQEMRVVNSKGLPVRVTVSAGIAGVQASDEVHPERLYGRADRALYVAKRNGRNRVERYVSDGSATMVPTA